MQAHKTATPGFLCEHAIPEAIVEPGGIYLGMSGEFSRAFQPAAMVQIGGNPRRPEGMTGGRFHLLPLPCFLAIVNVWNLSHLT